MASATLARTTTGTVSTIPRTTASPYRIQRKPTSTRTGSGTPATPTRWSRTRVPIRWSSAPGPRMRW
jgi:hypothetical protein